MPRTKTNAPTAVMKPRDARPAGRAAFTLIELLVVASIIALLIAMLIPAISRAKDSAKAIACLSGERQIFLGFPTYAQTYRDYFPVPAAPSVVNINGVDSNSANEWHIKLGEVGVWGPPVAGTYRTTGLIPVKRWGWPVLRCPGEAGAAVLGGYTYFEMENGRASYAMNFSTLHHNSSASYYGIPRANWSSEPFIVKALSGRPPLNGPAEATLVLDVGAHSNAYVTSFFDNQDDDTSAVNFTEANYTFRHNGTANMLYFDGHAKAVKRFAETGVYNYVLDYDRENVPVCLGTPPPVWPLFSVVP